MVPVWPWDRSCWTTTPAGCESSEVHPPARSRGRPPAPRLGQENVQRADCREVIDEMTDSRSDFLRLWPLL